MLCQAATHKLVSIVHCMLCLFYKHSSDAAMASSLRLCHKQQVGCLVQSIHK